MNQIILNIANAANGISNVSRSNASPLQNEDLANLSSDYLASNNNHQ